MTAAGSDGQPERCPCGHSCEHGPHEDDLTHPPELPDGQQEREALHRVEWGNHYPSFYCDGDQDADCHNYPDCECEEWDAAHEHPDVQQETCWVLPWLEASADADDHDDKVGVDGPIDYEYVGDGVNWWPAKASSS